MTARLSVIATLVAMTVSVTAASGQTNDNPFGFGTTLSGFAGASVDSEGTAPSAGLAVGWEFTRSFAVEGSTLWSAQGNGQHAFSALIEPKFTLMAGHRTTPFLSVGVGMYRASFDNIGAATPFYANRLAGHANGSATFDDFVASFGGGVELFINPHWAVRPDVRMLRVNGEGDHQWISVFGVHASYHFERHDRE